MTTYPQRRKDFKVFFTPRKGASINHVESWEEGGYPNDCFTTEALFSKSIHEEGGSQKFWKFFHVVYGWPRTDLYIVDKWYHPNSAKKEIDSDKVFGKLLQRPGVFQLDRPDFDLILKITSWELWWIRLAKTYWKVRTSTDSKFWSKLKSYNSRIRGVRT